MCFSFGLPTMVLLPVSTFLGWILLSSLANVGVN